MARLLAPDPADRYAKMSELAEDLDRWGANLPLIHARSAPGVVSRCARVFRRYRVPLASAAAVLLIVSSVGFVANVQMHRRLRAQAEAKLATIWDSGDPAIFRARRFGEWRLDDNAADLARRNLDQYAVLGLQA